MLLGIITKKLRKELHDTRKLLEREKQKGKEDAQERQELEIQIWKLESELRTYQYREKHIRDVLKYEYWERIRPLYVMGAADLKRSVRFENLFFDRDEKTWGVVESYCLPVATLAITVAVALAGGYLWGLPGVLLGDIASSITVISICLHHLIKGAEKTKETTRE